jgi:hypothetical protein
MPFQPPSRPLAVLASTLAATGLMLAVAGCGHIAPLGPDQAPPSLSPPRHLGSPVTVQVMRSQPPTAPGPCPAGTVDVFGLAPGVPRAAVAPAQPAQPVQGSTAAPAPTAAPHGPPVGLACFHPVGRPVTITSAAVSSVAAYLRPPGAKGPATYGFVVACSSADVAAVTAVIRQAYDSRDAVGISVAGKLWQAPRVLRPFSGQQFQIALLSRHQAVQLHRLLVPSG